VVRYNWNIEIKGRRYNIEVQLDVFLRLIATGSGRLFVNDKFMAKWGRNPFALIPKGKLDFQVAGKNVSIISKGTMTSSLALVLDGQEIPSVVAKG